MKYKFIIIGVLIIGAVIFFMVSNDSSNVSPDSTNSNKSIVISEGSSSIDSNNKIQFSYQDYQGNTVTHEDFAGTPLVINSWASWCPFCIDELPDFAAIQKEFAGQVVFIAIDRSESLDTAKGYSDELKVTDDLIFLLDPDDSFYKTIGGFSMPETIFVDSKGIVTFQRRGQMQLNEIQERTLDLISS